jgi:ABC-type multidrug transport system ATPase subunit
MTTDTARPAPARPAAGTALAIEAHDLVKTYPKGVRALDGLSFAVPAGTVFGLLGPNGAGKSTAVKILTTLAQADSGTARVAGLDVRAKPARVRHLIGVVAQLSGTDPVATGRENVMLSGRIQGLRGRDLARRTDHLASRLAIVDRGRIVVAGTPDELKGELRGDAIHLELASGTPRDPVLAALARVPGVRDARVEGTSLSARADEGATALPAVLAALEGAGVTVRAATVARPSLDDVYLRYSGRRFPDADQSPATPATSGGSK